MQLPSIQVLSRYISVKPVLLAIIP